MTCQFEKMPYEMLLTQTTSYSGEDKWKSYRLCYHKYLAVFPNNVYGNCQNRLPKHCLWVAGVAMENNCHWYKYLAEKKAGIPSVWDGVLEDTGDRSWVRPEIMKQFQSYVQCMHSSKIKEAVRHCIPDIKKKCESASIIAAKVLRMHVWDLDSMLTDHPDWKVVHQIRDPRAIVMSERTSGIWSSMGGRSIIEESIYACDKLLNDTLSSKLFSRDISPSKGNNISDSTDKITAFDPSSRERPTRSHPGQVLLIRYEDYADHPLGTVENVYSHVGAPVPNAVAKAIRDFTNSKDAGAMDQHRTNSSQTARNWMNKMNTLELQKINNICHNFYEAGGYVENVDLRSQRREKKIAMLLQK